MTKTAVVVGGSIAGLLHGIMLRDNGYNVTILERDPSAHRQGLDAGIRVGPGFIQFMQEHDRTQREFGIMATYAQVLDKAGVIKFKLPFNSPMTSWGLVWSILRANFDGQASRAVQNPPLPPKDSPKVKYWIGAKMADVEDRIETVRVRFDDVSRGKTEVIDADLVIAADGSTSSVRKILLSDINSEYAGYVTWRGTLQEDRIDKEFHDVFGKDVIVHRMHRSHFIIYIIPTDDGVLTPGKRLINWVWYHELTGGAPSLAETMTDINGNMHQGTVPRELIRPEVWKKQKTIGISTAAACVAHLLERTESPFVTKIYDHASPQAAFMGGKLLLVGDALVKFRPHCALSTNQAALDCLALEEVVKGRLSMMQWERKVLNYGHRMFLWSRLLGNFQQGYWMALLWSIWKFLVGYIGLSLRLLPRRSRQ